MALLKTKTDDAFDPQKEEAANVSPGRLRAQAQSRRDSAADDVDDMYASGEAKKQMKNNLKKLVKDNDLVPAKFKGQARLLAEGWVYKYGEFRLETANRSKNSEQI